jgi:hypothetical protein
MHSAVDHAVRSVAVHRFARWADAGVGLRVVREVLRSEQTGFVGCGGGGGLVVERVGLAFVFGLTGEPLVALSHGVVGYQGGDVLRV